MRGWKERRGRRGKERKGKEGKRRKERGTYSWLCSKLGFQLQQLQQPIIDRLEKESEKENGGEERRRSERSYIDKELNGKDKKVKRRQKG